MIKKIIYLLLFGGINISDSSELKLCRHDAVSINHHNMLMLFTKAPPHDKKNKSNLRRLRNGTRKKRYTDSSNINRNLNYFILN